MLDDAGDEGKALPVDVHLGAAADRKDRPEEAEDDQKDEGDDVVGDRLQAHGQDAQGLEQASSCGSSRRDRRENCRRPGDQRRADEQAERPRQRLPDQRRDRRRECRQRRPEIARRHASPEGDILLPGRAFQAVEFAQRLAHHLDHLGAGLAEHGDGADRLLDRVDRREVGDEIGDVDADEDDQNELREASDEIERVSSHRFDRAAACIISSRTCIGERGGVSAASLAGPPLLGSWPASA